MSALTQQLAEALRPGVTEQLHGEQEPAPSLGEVTDALAQTGHTNVVLLADHILKNRAADVLLSD